MSAISAVVKRDKFNVVQRFCEPLNEPKDSSVIGHTFSYQKVNRGLAENKRPSSSRSDFSRDRCSSASSARLKPIRLLDHDLDLPYEELAGPAFTSKQPGKMILFIPYGNESFKRSTTKPGENSARLCFFFTITTPRNFTMPKSLLMQNQEDQSLIHFQLESIP